MHNSESMPGKDDWNFIPYERCLVSLFALSQLQ